jgi:type I restriction enzyme, S subunit
MGDWTDTTLEHIAARTARAFSMGPFGSNIKAENYQKSGVPVIRGVNLSERGGTPFIADNFVFLSEDKADELASATVAPNDIVFVAQGTVGKVGVVPTDTPYCRFILSQNTMKVTVDPKRADPQFVFYYFRSDLGQHEIMSRVNPTGVPCISKPLASLRQFGIRLPTEIHEQEAIASILSALDHKIDLNRRMNATLEAMARAIFKDWFVDFGPTRAKMEGRAPYLAPDIWALFPERLDDDGKPEGWQSDRLGSVTDLQNGYAFKSSDWQAEGVPVVKIGSVKPAVVDLTEVSFVTPELAKDRASFQLRIGDVLVGLTGYVGETGRVPPTHNPPLLNQRVARFSSADGFSPFVYACVRNSEFKSYCVSKAHGSAQANVSTKDLLDYPVIDPSAKTRDAYNSIAGVLFARSLANLGEVDILATTRDLLLPKLMSGELRVKEAEKAVEAVA